MVRDIYMTNHYETAVIGNQGLSFTGGFNGNGKMIAGLHIETTANDYLGLFGNVGAGGAIKDLSLSDVEIYCGRGTVSGYSDFVGTLAGVAEEDSHIVNCHVSGIINGGNYIGGVVGVGDGNIISCSFNGIVVGMGGCGGVIGNIFESGRVERSCFKGVVSCENGGGFVGVNFGNIEFCYAIGGVCSSQRSGGFVWINQPEGVIRECYSQALAYNNHEFGGFVGGNDDGVIQRCYACGARTFYDNDGAGANGFTSFGTTDNITECFWDIDLCVRYDNIMRDAPTGTNTLAMQTKATYTDSGWNFYKSPSGMVDGWYLPENDYPVLFWQSEYFLICPPLEGLGLTPMQTALVDAGFTLGSVIYTNSLTVASEDIIGASVASGCSYLTNAPPVDIFISTGIGGDGSDSAPYPIACEADLQAVNNDLNAHYYLVRNMDLLEKYQEPVILGSFRGVLDGRGNLLVGLEVGDGQHYAGLMEYLNTGSQVINLSIENAIVNSGQGAGIMACGMEGGIISNCYVQGSVKGGGVGGFVGYIGRSSGIFNSGASVFVEGSYDVGGIAGSCENSSLSFCSVSGRIQGQERVGGLVGAGSECRIEDSDADIYVKGASGGNLVGGLVGEFREGGAILRSSVHGLIAGDTYVGGFAGTFNNAIVEECYCSGTVMGNNYVGGFAVDLYQCRIFNSYSRCAVVGGEITGGFCVEITVSSVSNCYAAGIVSGDNTSGLATYIYGSSVTSCFWDVETSGVTVSVVGTGTNSVAMQDEATFSAAGWDLDNIWYMDGYPKLRAHVDSSQDRFQLWTFDSGAPVGGRGPQDCPAGDNIPNLLKYAVGLAPLTICSTADLMLPLMDDSEGKFTVTYQKSKDAAGVTLYPTWTGSLQAPEWQGSGLNLRKLSEEASTELWEASLPVADRSSAFIRLNAERLED